MSTFFVPYADDMPLAFEVKGHRLILLSSDDESIRNELDYIGGDELRELVIDDERPEESAQVARLAASAHGGVVVLPAGITPKMMIASLQSELPWVN